MIYSSKATWILGIKTLIGFFQFKVYLYYGPLYVMKYKDLEDEWHEMV